MGERERYEPGTFRWVDLGTDDALAAKAFYMSLFDWDAEDMPMGPDGAYTMFSVGGRHVAALYRRGADQGPPAWLSYVSVDDVDAVAARAREAGATVGDPFDVYTSGRMAIVEDPTGAHFAAWQPRDHIGAGLVNAHGALTMNQLNTSDPDQAAAFYAVVFGWRAQQVSQDPPYWGILNGQALNGGMMALPAGVGAPSHWLVYFAVDDLDRAVAHVAELGGRVLLGPVAVPAGRFVVVTDPQGATFALSCGTLDP